MNPSKPTASTAVSWKDMLSLPSSEERGNPSELSNVSSGPSAPSRQLLNPVDHHDMDPPSYSAVMTQDEIAGRNQIGPSTLLENQPVPGIPSVETLQPQVDPTVPITVQPQTSTTGFKEALLALGEPPSANPHVVIIESTDDEAAKKNQPNKPKAFEYLPIMVPDPSCHHVVYHGGGNSYEDGCCKDHCCGDCCCGDDCCGDNCCGDGCCGDDCCGDDCCGDDCCGDGCCGDDCCGNDADCGDCTIL